MRIVVPIQLVPDLVEELAVNQDGTGLDIDYLRFIVNEFDDHAIEQAILLKERFGGQVIVLAPDIEGVDDILFTSAAKGADRIVKLTGDFNSGLNNHALTRALAPVIKELQPDLILTGVQTHNNLDGPLGPQLAETLSLPYIGYVCGLTASEQTALVRKEYPGGLAAEMETSLPAVLGIQASEKPPRYVPISKVRMVMKSCKIEEEDAGDLDLMGGVAPGKMYPPEAAERAEMIEGDADEVAARIVAILQEQGIL